MKNFILPRQELLQRVGNLTQIGGTRHYILADGRSKGVSAVDVNTGSGLNFTVLPDRGMDISLASFKGNNLVYLAPNGEAHPAYYEPEGLNWIRTFFGGLLTTCGLTYIGAPGLDGSEELGLHGRYSCLAAQQFCDRSRWENDEYVLELTGIIEEAASLCNKLRLTRRITSRLGAKSLHIHDTVENFDYKSSPFTILYHINFGYPLLDCSSRIFVQANSFDPVNAHSAEHADQRFVCSEPKLEEANNYLYTMKADKNGYSRAALINPDLAGGLGAYIRFDARSLPFLNEWKMLSMGDYVVALEPCNAPCENRSFLRQTNRLPFLQPGETRDMHVEIGVLEGAEEIAQFEKECQ